MGEASREIWLHIGLPKCGSTTVQRYFARHYGANLRQGLCYPHACRAEQGYRNHKPLARLTPESLDAAIAEIATEAAQSNRILLSCEDWGKSVTEHNLLALVEAIHRGMPDRRVRFVAFFRNIYGFVESSFAQFVIGGLFGVSKGAFFSQDGADLERFLRIFEDHRGFPLYSVLGHARALLENLPSDTVSLRSVETDDLTTGDMVEDLCGLLDVRFRGATAPKNRRRPDRQLAEAIFLQSTEGPAVFGKMRPDMRRQPLTGTTGEAFRGEGLHIGAGLHRLMALNALQERDALGALFDTGVDALFEDRWTSVPGKDRLSEADRNALTEQAVAYR